MGLLKYLLMNILFNLEIKFHTRVFTEGNGKHNKMFSSSKPTSLMDNNLVHHKSTVKHQNIGQMLENYLKAQGPEETALHSYGNHRL